MKTHLRCCKHEIPHSCFAHMQKVASPDVPSAVPLNIWIHMQIMTIKLILYILNPMCQVTIIFLQMNFSVFLKKERYLRV